MSVCVDCQHYVVWSGPCSASINHEHMRQQHFRTPQEVAALKALLCVITTLVPTTLFSSMLLMMCGCELWTRVRVDHHAHLFEYATCAAVVWSGLAVCNTSNYCTAITRASAVFRTCCCFKHVHRATCGLVHICRPQICSPDCYRARYLTVAECGGSGDDDKHSPHLHAARTRADLMYDGHVLSRSLAVANLLLPCCCGTRCYHYVQCKCANINSNIHLFSAFGMQAIAMRLQPPAQ